MLICNKFLIFLLLGCGKEYTNSNSFYRHKATHDELVGPDGNKKPLECTECGKNYLTHQSMLHHKKNHVIDEIEEALLRGEDVTEKTNEFNIKCDSCPRVFLTSVLLSKHKKSQHSFKCGNCQAKFVTEEQFKRHFLHPGNSCKLGGMEEDKPIRFSCDFCGEKFQHCWLLQIHQKRRHAKWKREAGGGNDAKAALVCGICGVESKNKIELKSHHRTQHAPRVSKKIQTRKGSTNNATACYVQGCNDIFTSNQALASHLRVNHPALFRSRNGKAGRVYRDTRHDEALLLRSSDDGAPLFVLQEVVDGSEGIIDETNRGLGSIVHVDEESMDVTPFVVADNSFAPTAISSGETYLLIDDGNYMAEDHVATLIANGSYELVHSDSFLC